MTWIKAHTLTDAGEEVTTIINSDHITRVRRTKEGRAQILWAVSNRPALTLVEPYDYVVSKLNG
jgi:hypothetical protein